MNPGEPMLPGRQLAAAIERALRRVMRPNPWGYASAGDISDGRARAFYGSLGVSPRLVDSWSEGVRRVALSRADHVLLTLDLLWFDVWNEETVRLPIIEVRTYKRQRLKPNGRRYREPGRTVGYGDRGPDHRMLAAIEAAWTGEPVLCERHSRMSYSRLRLAWEWLLEQGPAPAAEVARALGITHKEASQAIRSLTEKRPALVVVEPGVKPLYRAVPAAVMAA